MLQACTLDSPQLVKFIIKTMEDKFGQQGVLDLLAQEDDDGNTPLFICVESGSYESARELLEAGADVNHFNMDTMYPLHIGCTSGHLEMVQASLPNCL